LVQGESFGKESESCIGLIKKESMEDGKLKTVEDLLKAKGEKIRKGRVNMDGTIEYEGE